MADEHDERDEPPSAGRERLDSWKEIASYLKRSVRSVQRWEAEEAMPVHRHVHDKRGTIYGFKDELDEWWTERGSILADRNGVNHEARVPDPDPPDHVAVATVAIPRWRHWKAALVGTSFAAVILVVGVVALLSRTGSGPPSSAGPLPFKARDWILVAAFDNRTGEALFDGALEHALTRELANSRYVNVVSRERIADALRLMRKPPDTRLDSAVGREVCLRDGEIRALLDGRVERLGAGYLISVQVVDPHQGAALAAFSEQASSKEASLAAVRRISGQVRKALGETGPAGSDTTRLARVTTSNLRALQLYSRADALIAQGNSAAAAELLELAVAADPGFAAAYMHLAFAVYNQNRSVDEVKPHLEAALRLSATASDRERLFIRGGYHLLLNQPEPAVAALEALLSLYPDDYWAPHKLLMVYSTDLRKNSRRVLQLELLLANQRPREFSTNFAAAYNYATYERDPGRAEPYLRRARDLVTPEVVEGDPWGVSWLELYPYTQHWMQGNLEAAAGELDRFASRIGPVRGEARDVFAGKALIEYLTLGRLARAESMSEEIRNPGIRRSLLAQIALVKGDRVGLRKHLRSPGDRSAPGSWLTTTVLQASTGLLPLARESLAAMKKERFLWTSRQESVRAAIAVAEGDLEEAALQLEVPLQDGGGRRWFYLAAESLADALENQGNLQAAIRVLERSSKDRIIATFNNDSGPFWLRNRFRLASLYRRAGRDSEARTVEAELRKLLALADTDHPILVAIQAAGATS